MGNPVQDMLYINKELWLFFNDPQCRTHLCHLCSVNIMAKYLCSLKSYETQAEAMKVAEAVFTATRGMFACLEGQVWISHNGAFGYKVWIIEEGASAYVPCREEVSDACGFENIGLFFLANSTLKSWKTLTTNKVVKWVRFN